MRDVLKKDNNSILEIIALYVDCVKNQEEIRTRQSRLNYYQYLKLVRNLMRDYIKRNKLSLFVIALILQLDKEAYIEARRDSSRILNEMDFFSGCNFFNIDCSSESHFFAVEVDVIPLESKFEFLYTKYNQIQNQVSNLMMEIAHLAVHSEIEFFTFSPSKAHPLEVRDNMTTASAKFCFSCFLPLVYFENNLKLAFAVELGLVAQSNLMHLAPVLKKKTLFKHPEFFKSVILMNSPLSFRKILLDNVEASENDKYLKESFDVILSELERSSYTSIIYPAFFIHQKFSILEGMSLDKQKEYIQTINFDDLPNYNISEYSAIIREELPLIVERKIKWLNLKPIKFGNETNAVIAFRIFVEKFSVKIFTISQIEKIKLAKFFEEFFDLKKDCLGYNYCNINEPFDFKNSEAVEYLCCFLMILFKNEITSNGGSDTNIKNRLIYLLRRHDINNRIKVSDKLRTEILPRIRTKSVNALAIDIGLKNNQVFKGHFKIKIQK